MAKKSSETAAEAVPAGKTVDGYIAGLSGWQAEVLNELRDIVRTAAPTAKESIKWAQPVYEENGPFIFIKAFRNHINFGFWRGAQMNDPKGFFQGDGERMRHIKLAGLDDVDRKTFTALVKEAVKLNREHGDPTKRS